MRDFYQEMSSGRFAWTGQVSNWVKLSGTAANYGANSRESGAGGDDLNGSVQRVVGDTLKAIAANGYAGLDLAKADQVDRYDCDGDGVYAEPTGTSTTSGSFTRARTPAAGRSAAMRSGRTARTPTSTTNRVPRAASSAATSCRGTDLWAGDYTIEAENGGVGVFAHEFGHDLGLPDLYDRVSGDNGTGFWTLMSSGSWDVDAGGRPHRYRARAHGRVGEAEPRLARR